MKFLKLLTFISIAIAISAFSMEQLPQPEKSHLERLPGDLQRYLLPFILSSKSIRADVDTIFSLASANKCLNTFINHEDTLKHIITACAKTHYRYDEVAIAHYLQNMHGMQTAIMKAWVAKRKDQIYLEKKLLTESSHDDPRSIHKVNDLLHQGVNPNIYSRITKRTPLVHATLLANTQMITSLLQAGANPNFLPIHYLDFTPLIAAIGKRRKDLVELLLTAGARTDLKFKEFGTALDYTRAKGYTEIEQLLLVHGAKERARNKQ